MMRFEHYKPEDILPILDYKIGLNNVTESKEIDMESKLSFGLDKIPDWVRQNIRTGNKGEGIAWLYFKSFNYIYNRVDWVSQMNDKAGYDIAVAIDDSTRYYEVKSTNHPKDTISFFMSKNEMNSVIKNGSSYIVFYIRMYNETAEGVFIRNLFELIEQAKMHDTLFQSIDATISCEQIKITLKDCSLYKFFDLTKELQVVNRVLRKKKRLKFRFLSRMTESSGSLKKPEVDIKPIKT